MGAVGLPVSLQAAVTAGHPAMTLPTYPAGLPPNDPGQATNPATLVAGPIPTHHTLSDPAVSVAAGQQHDAQAAAGPEVLQAIVEYQRAQQMHQLQQMQQMQQLRQMQQLHEMQHLQQMGCNVGVLVQPAVALPGGGLLDPSSLGGLQLAPQDYGGGQIIMAAGLTGLGPMAMTAPVAGPMVGHPGANGERKSTSRRGTRGQRADVWNFARGARKP